MYDLHCYARKTHKYRAGWSSWDDWDYLTTLRVTPLRSARDSRGFDDGGTYVQYVRLPAGVNRKAKARIIRSIEDTISGTGCKHQYDCCGCASHRATVRSISRRDLLIHTSVSFNY